MKKALPALLFLLCTGVASAHVTGTSYEQVIGENRQYKVDIGYDPDRVMAGERVVFDFNIKDAKTLQSVAFDDVWVRIIHNKQTLLATGLEHMAIGPTTLLYVVPENVEGEITVSMRFEEGDTSIAETEFSIPIEPPANAADRYKLSFMAGSIGLLIGAGIMYAFLRFVSRK
jgi:hypothetical protein